MIVLFRLVALLLCFAMPVNAAEPFWPDARYSAEVPTLKQVLGHDHGEKISSPDEVVLYLRAINKAAPDRTRLVTYATSWEGRPLQYLVVSSASNMAQLEANQKRMHLLSDARLQGANKTELLRLTKPVSWLSYGVHGDEISSTDAALLMIYHLLAAEDNETVSRILNNSYVVIDPSQNPDGRSRFVHHFEQTLGLEPAAHPLAAEHIQPWPGGRTNHYLFDMNRDWFALTQPETRGKIQHYLKFHPVVHADIHEMGVNSTYYFPPPAEPFNPFISDQQKVNLNLYGKGNAAAFDDFGFDYFTREIFDAHYAGYGDTWPAFHGAIGMTFEMASARGLVQEKDNGEALTYRQGVHQHFVSSMATALTTANNAQRLLKDWSDYRQSALSDDRHYVFSKGDTSLQSKLANNLTLQGIEVHQLSTDSRICGTSYQSATMVVKAGQPAGRLVRTLLDADSPIEAEFWQRQEKKREQGLEVELYDVLAWSLPGLFGLDVEICDRKIDELTAYVPRRVEGGESHGQFAYLVRNDSSASTQFLAAALRHGLPVLNFGAGFSKQGKDFDAGTLAVKVADLTDQQHQTLHELAALHSIELLSIDNSWTDSGINFGSSKVTQIKAPSVALVWDEPTSSYAAGNTRFVVEQQLGYPVTPIRTAYLFAQQLDDFDVLIIPHGGDYATRLGARGQSNVKRWIEQGGTLITMGGATKLLLSDGLDLLSTRLEANTDRVSSETEEGLADASTIDSASEYLAILAEGAYKPDYVPGVIARAAVDDNHWLAAGVNTTVNLVVVGRDVYTPLKHGEGTNVLRFEDESKLVLGGYLWQENREQLAYKPALMETSHGSGSVIAFTVDPTFRGYMDGLHVVLGNAIFKSASR